MSLMTRRDEPGSRTRRDLNLAPGQRSSSIGHRLIALASQIKNTFVYEGGEVSLAGVREVLNWFAKLVDSALFDIEKRISVLDSRLSALSVGGEYVSGTINVVGARTISSGAFALPTHTLPGIWIVQVVAQSGTADDLDTISGLVTGDVAILHSEHTITFTESGNMSIDPFGSFAITDTKDKVTLVSQDGSTWTPISLRNNE